MQGSGHEEPLADEPADPSAIQVLRRYCGQVEIIRFESPVRWVRAARSLALGRTVTEALRAAVVREALRGRRGPGRARNTLRVRVDVPDPEL